MIWLIQQSKLKDYELNSKLNNLNNDPNHLITGKPAHILQNKQGLDPYESSKAELVNSNQNKFDYLFICKF